MRRIDRLGLKRGLTAALCVASITGGFAGISVGCGADGGGDPADIDAPGDITGADGALNPDGVDGADDTDGPDDATGDAASGAEQAWVELLMDDQPHVIALGGSTPLSVEVPPNTVSVVINVLGEGDASLALASWTGPDGSVLVENGWFQDQGNQGGLCLTCTNRIAPSLGAFATIAPNNPAATLVPGTHFFTLFGVRDKPVVTSPSVCGDGICFTNDPFQCPQDCQPSLLTGDVQVTVHAKISKDGAVPDSGVIDINAHFTGAQGLTAANAADDPRFISWIDKVGSLYAQVGMTIGEVAYIDIDSKYKVIEDVTGVNSDLQAMFAESAGSTMNAANLFFVDSLKQGGALGGFGVILGIAGGIPGPTLLQGNFRAGVAIAIKPVAGAPGGVDTTFGHELGHFLGLFHTSEQNFFGGPAIHDPLPDTPEDDPSYLMFNTGAGSKLSPWQGRIMRSNPWVRHPAEDTLDDGVKP